MAIDNAVVALIVELRNSGLAYPVIADRLNELGISTERGRAWADHSVAKIAIEAGVPVRAKAARSSSTAPEPSAWSGPRVLTEAQRESFTSPRKAADVERQIAARFMDQDEVAELLGLTSGEVWLRALRGEIPSSHAPGSGVRRYPRAAVEALAAQVMHSASPDAPRDNDTAEVAA